MFVVPPTGRLEDYAALVEKAHALAGKYGRTVRVGAMCYAVIEADDAAARRTVAWLEAEADREAILNYVNSIAGTSNQMAEEGVAGDPWAGLDRDAFLKVALGMTGNQLFGGYQTVAEKMRGLAEVGVDNVVVGFFDPAKGLRQMEEHVIPILERMGLRA